MGVYESDAKIIPAEVASYGFTTLIYVLKIHSHSALTVYNKIFLN